MPFLTIDPMPELKRTVRVPIAQFAQYEARLGRAIRQEVFKNAMPAAGKQVRILLEQETIKRKIFHRKRFAKGWRMTVGEQSSSVRIYNKEPYASVIEYGRRPGARRPPVQALIPWVRDKMGLQGKAARGAAFAIARKIGQRGIKARPVLRSVQVQQRVQKKVAGVVLTKLRLALARTT